MTFNIFVCILTLMQTKERHRLLRNFSRRYYSFIGGIILRVLGERLNGIQEVSGSIPLISTTGSSSFIFLPAQIEWVFFVY